ncbi:transcriptional regulator [Pullulanibacillus pueri]|uniref:Transcriptional regulator n=1 Tax=Pullulanibacillus pueri TaxID=1437324 RepID=A0A8J2ZW15_9BACL|nr:FMN-binding negative transcriptional regulator [Pullulanibacillus pueri]MBM7680909.1 transcriptional regulator [Pullulanibacillus pueri]GGH81294.1 hypothetical protein GCM10007096_18980 [Pullulanibacillus pueri]
MYLPRAYKEEDVNRLIQFIKKYSFGLLFSQSEEGPFSTHLPFIVDETRPEKAILLSHMAKANPHWKNINDQDVLVVFTGPHAYITPTWYQEENTVPTWNYTAVSVYGRVHIKQESCEKKEILERTTDFYEASQTSPWKVDFNDPVMEALTNGVVGIEIEIKKLEGKWKLNQNHSRERQQRVIAGLKTRKDDDSQEIARLMEENLIK